jgi:hypothetical protein
MGPSQERMMKFPGNLGGNKRLARALIVGQVQRERQMSEFSAQTVQQEEEVQPVTDEPLVADASATEGSDAS